MTIPTIAMARPTVVPYGILDRQEQQHLQMLLQQSLQPTDGWSEQILEFELFYYTVLSYQGRVNATRAGRVKT